MKKLDDNLKSAGIFLGVTFGAGWLILLIAFIMGFRDAYASYSGVLSIMMIAPLGGNLAARVLTGEGFERMRIKPNFRHNIIKYICSYFFPIIFIAGGMMIFYMLNNSALDSAATIYSEAWAEAYDMDINQGYGTFLTSTIIFPALVAPLSYILFAFMSELGWRGYLLQKLTNKFGMIRAALFTGVCQWVWFLPLVIMGFSYGRLYTSYPFGGIGLSLLFFVGLSFVESYFTYRIGSVIPAALFFSAVYSLKDIGLYFLTEEYTRDITAKGAHTTELMLLGPSATGLFGMAVILLAGLLYLFRFRRMEWDEYDEKVSNVRGERKRKSKEADEF